MPEIRYEVTVAVVTDVPITQEELGQHLSLAKSRAHVILELGAIQVARPHIEKPGESTILLTFAPPQQSGIVRPG